MLMSWLFKVGFALVAYGKCFSVVVLAEIRTPCLEVTSYFAFPFWCHL